VIAESDQDIQIKSQTPFIVGGNKDTEIFYSHTIACGQTSKPRLCIHVFKVIKVIFSLKFV